MDGFLATLFIIFSHSATALLLQIMNRLAQKSIHSGFTFVFKQPLNPAKNHSLCRLKRSGYTALYTSLFPYSAVLLSEKNSPTD